MSHFTTLVILNDNLTGTPKEMVSEMLAPYDENIQVPEYETDCHCIGDVARQDARKVAEEKCGTIDDLRKSFAEKYPVDESNIQEAILSDEREKAWKEHIAEYLRVEKEAFENHPMKDKPDPTCGFYHEDYDGHKKGERYDDNSGCGGTGKYLTTYSSKSKWDWWTIGGRWQGALDKDYDYTKDERNWETCRICYGSGMRSDVLGCNERAKDPNYTCNGCNGTGKSLKFTLAPHEKGNYKNVSDIHDFVPFAIVTPDGEWHERGHMGWWAMVSDEKDNWEEEVKKILEENKGHLAVLVDCHI